MPHSNPPNVDQNAVNCLQPDTPNQKSPPLYFQQAQAYSYRDHHPFLAPFTSFHRFTRLNIRFIRRVLIAREPKTKRLARSIRASFLAICGRIHQTYTRIRQRPDTRTHAPSVYTVYTECAHTTLPSFRVSRRISLLVHHHHLRTRKAGSPSHTPPTPPLLVPFLPLLFSPGLCV